MNSQFIHIEVYSREEPAAKTRNKQTTNHRSDVRHTTVSGVLSEMKRDKGFTSHLDDIHEPIVLHGSIDALERSIERYEAEHRTVDKNGKEKKLRKDACVLLAGVISLDREDQEIWEDYKAKSIKYLKTKYGKNLKCVVEHTDEKNPHIHFYVVSKPGHDLNLLHDGKKAVSLLSKEEKKKQHLSVYTKAMISFQDDFYSKVSNAFGLSRTGENPRERLRSRPDYLRFKKRQQEALNKLSDMEKTVKQATTKGFNQGIKQFDQKTWLGKLDWRLKKRMLPLQNKINILSVEKEKIEKTSSEKDKTINEISKQRDNASIKNMSYISDINRLEAENKDLLPYKMDFDKIFERAKRPFIEENNLLKGQNQKLNTENRDLRAKDNEFSEFVDTVKAYYGENYDEWHKEVFKKSQITPKF